MDLCNRTRCDWLSKSSLNVVHGNTLDDLLEKIENSNGHEEDAKKLWHELERLQAMPPVMFLTRARLFGNCLLFSLSTLQRI